MSSFCTEDFLEAIADNEWESAEELLDEFPRDEKLPLVDEDHEELTVLAIALRCGAHVDLLTKLALLTDREHCISGQNGVTLLHVCTYYYSNLATKEIIARHNPEAIVMMDGHGDTPIDNLFCGGYHDNGAHLTLLEQAETMLMLLRLCPSAKYARNIQGRNLLHRALLSAEQDEEEEFVLLEALLEEAPHMIREQDAMGLTPFHIAATFNDDFCHERLDLLVGYTCGCTLKRRDNAGRTPLHHATQGKNDWFAVEWLVENVPGAIDMCDEQGNTPLDEFRVTHADLLKNCTGNGRNRDHIAKTLMLLMTGTYEKFSVFRFLKQEKFTIDVGRAVFMCASDVLLTKGRFVSQLKQKNKDGDLPLHVISMRSPDDDEMELYNDAVKQLLDLNPLACREFNAEKLLPLEVMKNAGHSFDHGMKVLIERHPAAVVDLGLDQYATCTLLSRLGNENQDGLFRLLTNAPFLLQRP